MNQPRKFIAIRHAETDLAGTFCGQSDPEVNARGRAQIETLVSNLRGYPIDTLYTSSLRRALNTADALAKSFKLNQVVRPDLQEIAFGDWEGLTWNEIAQKDGVFAQRWLDNYPSLCVPNGERFDAFKKRVMNEIFDLVTLSKDQMFAVVTHAGVMRVLLTTLEGMSENEAWKRSSAYCSFVELSILNLKRPVGVER
jgi:broad specificity phosphatase PhoE